MTYDAAGRLTTVTRPDPDGSGGPEVQFTYDSGTNQMTSYTRATGATTTLQYDAAGSLSSRVEPGGALGHVTRMDRDHNVTIEVYNTPPVAEDDGRSWTLRNTRPVVEAPGVLGNDWDDGDDPLTAVLDTTPMYGYLEYLDSDSSFSYLPSSGFFGTDQFYYRASDGIDESEQPAKVSIAVVDMDLKSVRFHWSLIITSDPDPDGQTIEYAGPHWEVDEVEGERSWPVAYVRNRTMFVSAQFDFSPSFCAVSGSGEILVRAFGPDEIEVPARAVSLWGDYAILEETWVDTPFPNEVRHYDQFALNWQASSNGGETWIDVGTSQNDLYLSTVREITVQCPLAPRGRGQGEGAESASVISRTVLTWDAPLGYPLNHTVVHLGSTNGKNAADHDNEAEVLDAIWAEFSDLQVQTANGMPLWYYKDWTTTKSQAGMLLQPVGSGDDQHGDGTCDAWVDLFRTVLKAQGIDSGTAKTIRADNVMYSQPPLNQEVRGFVVGASEWHSGC